MTRFHEKVEGRTKQIVGHMVGGDEPIAEGKAQERATEPGKREVDSGLQGPLDPPSGDPARDQERRDQKRSG